jgi:hypothetical protein
MASLNSQSDKEEINIFAVLYSHLEVWLERDKFFLPQVVGRVYFLETSGFIKVFCLRARARETERERQTASSVLQLTDPF